MSTLRVDSIRGQTADSVYKFVTQVHQFTASEQSVSSATVLINSSFTPKFSNSKFFVHFTLPNITLTEGNYVDVFAYLGTSSTATSNTNIIYIRTSGQGTGASNTQTVSASDFGTFTASGTDDLYASLRVSPESAATIARHSAVVKMQVMEIAQ